MTAIASEKRPRRRRRELAQVIAFARKTNAPPELGDALSAAIDAAEKLKLGSSLDEIETARERLTEAQRRAILGLFADEDIPGSGGQRFSNPALAMQWIMGRIPFIQLALKHLAECTRHAPHAGTADVIDLATVRLAMNIAKKRARQ